MSLKVEGVELQYNALSLMMARLILVELMRKISDSEKMTINFLARVANVDLSIAHDELVWEVNPAMGSIRAESCGIKCRVKVISNCQYVDEDNVPVVVMLLLKYDRSFGELDFWKVNDQPIINYPISTQQFTKPMSFNNS